MGKKFEQNLEELKKQRKVGEEIEHIPVISGKFHLIIFIAVAALSFIAGRIFTGQIVILLITNIVSMWMVVDVARVLINTQDACILITNKRIYGKANQKDINIYFRDVKQIVNGKQGIYIDGGNAHDCILLKYVADKEETYRALCNHVK